MQDDISLLIYVECSMEVVDIWSSESPWFFLELTMAYLCGGHL